MGIACFVEGKGVEGMENVRMVWVACVIRADKWVRQFECTGASRFGGRVGSTADRDQGA